MPTITYVQGGADFRAPKQTKAALKEAIKSDPDSVFLYDTTAIRPSKFSDIATKLPEDFEFNVVGPDPYTARDWYATVYWGYDGKLKKLKVK